MRRRRAGDDNRELGWVGRETRHGGIVKTYGYDYVFALRASTVNAILASNLARTDQSISYSAPDPDSGSTVTLHARLAPWQVAGGQNTLINVNMPISEGQLSVEGGAITGTYDLGGVIPEMQVTLGWVGKGDQQAARGSGDQTHLTFDPGPGQDKDNPGYVATLQIHDPEKKLDDLATGILTELMASALFVNHDKVAYVFANVDPAPAQLASWLAPGEWQYYISQAGDGDCVFCFLCMMGQGAAFPGQPAFDASGLQPGAGSVVLISQPVFFANVVLPAVRRSLSGGTFQLSTDANGFSTITNSGGFNVGTVSASSYRLTASPGGDGLATASSGGGPLKFLFGLANLPDASYSWSVSTVNPVRFDGQNISFASDPNPVTHHDFTMYWYDWALLVVLGITSAAGLASTIGDLVNNFADQVQNVGMPAITDGLQAATSGAVVNLSEAIDWTKDGQSLATTAAGMSESVFVAGNLTVRSG